MVRLLWRRRQQQHGDLDLWLDDVRDGGGQGRPDADGGRPGDRHGRHGHHDDQHHLGARGGTGPDATGTITFTVFGPQATAPTTCTTGGTTVGTGTTVAGNATYNPSAGYTPGAAGDYWWYASYGGDANNNTATSTCGSTMSETVVAKAAPTLTATGPATGTIGDGHRDGQHHLGPRRRHHRPGGDRHHHLHRLRAPGHGPDHLHHRGHDGRHRDHGRRQRHLSPVGRLHADGCG